MTAYKVSIPIADNDTAANRAKQKNRIVVLPKRSVLRSNRTGMKAAQ